MAYCKKFISRKQSFVPGHQFQPKKEKTLLNWLHGFTSMPDFFCQRVLKMSTLQNKTGIQS